MAKGAEAEIGDKERWLPIADYEGWYEVSNLGRIRRTAPGKATHVGKVLKPIQRRDGYGVANLHRAGITNSGIYIHRIVMEAFAGPCPEGKEVNHKDGVKSNNHLENLEYLTPQENVCHASESGLSPRGERHGRSRLSESEVLSIRIELKERTQSYVAEKHNVSRQAISDIETRKTWGWLE